MSIKSQHIRIPSKVITDPLLESLLPTLEKYAYAEERRLFYVALTRAKQTVFIHTVFGQESDFLKELKLKSFDVNFDKNELNQYVIESAHCPECGTGSLIPRVGQYGLFYVCSLGKNYCDTLVSRCPSCEKAPLLRNNEFHYCASSDCDFKADCCPVCMTGRFKKGAGG
jgi:DNA helicase-4